MNILQKICDNKKNEIIYDKSKYSINTLEKLTKIEPNIGFSKLLLNKNKNKQNNIIGEIKKTSPSAGNIIKNYNPVEIASLYKNAGINALSVLTEKKYFEGELEHISLIKKSIKLPILRKDFIIDPYQVIQSKYYKADAILIIMSILSFEQAKEIVDTAKKYKLDTLIEIHDKSEINNALKLESLIIGINNRNLKTLETNLDNIEYLSKEIPKKFTIVAESGIKNKNDIKFCNKCGIYNFLIGESLLKSKNITTKVGELL